MADTIEREAYRFIPGPFQYSAGVRGQAWFRPCSASRFANPVLLMEGFKRIEAFMTAEGPAVHRVLRL